MGRHQAGAEDRLRDYFDSAGSTAGARSWLGAWQGRVPPDPTDELPPSRLAGAGGGRYDEGGDGRRLRRVGQHREVRRALMTLDAKHVAVLTLYYSTEVGWPGEARDDAGWSRSKMPGEVKTKLGEQLGRVALVTDALGEAWAKPGHRATSEARLLEALCKARGGDVLDDVEKQAKALHLEALLAFAAVAGLRVDLGREPKARRTKRAERLYNAVSVSGVVVRSGVRA